MSWYSTKEEAEKGAERKSIEWGGEEFIVIKDSKQPNCWWTQRKNYEYKAEDEKLYFRDKEDGPWVQLTK